MALTDENSMIMPVAPMYGGGYGNNGCFGGDWGWILLLLLCANGGWGGFGGFNGGNLAADGAMLYPWMNQSNQMSDGFRDQMMNTTLTGIQSAVNTGFGDTALGIAGINQNICHTGNGIVGAVNGAQNAISQQMYTNQISDLERSFANQTAITQGMNTIAMNQQNCCCENRAGLADLKYTVATENCADRTQSMQNTRDIIDSQNRGTQAILDKLCALELDGVKAQLAQAERENTGLQNQLNMANFAASQAAQTATFNQGLNNEVDALYNRLKNCPVPTMPVYGNTPIFTCGGNNCGCGCGNF